MNSRRALILLFLFTVAITAAYVFSYDNLSTHPDLSRASVELFNYNSSNKINNEQTEWIIKGAIDEDTFPRYLSHFYDPSTGKGLSGFDNAKPAIKWAKTQNSASGDYSEGAIFDNYESGNLKRAYEGIGHILHLIQDMSVPAHTRNDLHIDGDPYEKWAEQNGKADYNSAQFIKINNLDQAFDELARFSHDNFYSKDTVVSSELMNVKIVNNYAIKRIENINIKTSFVDYSSLKPIYKISEDYDLNSDYWKMLSPKAIGYSAGVIDYFVKGFEKIDQEKKKEQISFAQKIISGFNNFSSLLRYAWGDVWGTTLIAGSGIIKNTTSLQAEYQDFVENKAQSIAQNTMEIADSVKNVSGKILGEIEGAFTPTLAKKESINEVNEIKKEDIADTKREFIAVEKVIDGDTIKLTNGETVRYIGIDTPELNDAGPEDDECLAWVATLRNLELLKSGNLKLIKDENTDRDKYGRLLRYVYSGNIFVNRQLALDGLGKIFFCQPGWENCPIAKNKNEIDSILSAGKEAERNKRGLYSGVCEKTREETVIEKNNIVIKNTENELVKNIFIPSGNSVEPEKSVYQPPEVMLDKKPFEFASSTEAIFEFSNSVEGNDFIYNFDDNGWIATGSIAVFSNLSSGHHTIKVKSGTNPDLGDSADYEWVIDTEGPTAEIPDLAERQNENFSLSWLGADQIFGSGISNFDIQYKLGNGLWRDWIMATTSSEFFFNIADNEELIYFRVRATDKAGNIGEWSNEKLTKIERIHPVISELQAEEKEFIEIYNPSDSSIDMTRWFLAYYSSAGNWNNPFRKKEFPSGSTVPAHGYFLISAKDGDFDADWSLGYAGYFINKSKGAIAIFPWDPELKSAEENKIGRIDALAWGDAEYVKEQSPASSLATDQSLERKAFATSTEITMIMDGDHEFYGNGYDSDNNPSDFVIRNLPQPQNSLSQLEPREVFTPGAISDLIIDSKTSSSTSLNWTTPEHASGMGAYYDLRYKIKVGACDLDSDWDNGIEVPVANLPLPSPIADSGVNYDIKGLSANTEYCFALKIYNGDKWSLISNQVDDITLKQEILIGEIKNSSSIWSTQLLIPIEIKDSESVLVVSAYWSDDNKEAMSVKFGGLDFEKITEERGLRTRDNNSIWILKNPPVDSDLVEINYGEHMRVAGTVFALKYADPIDPVSASFHIHAQSENISNSIDVGKDNSLILDSISVDSGLGILVPGEEQIQIDTQTVYSYSMGGFQTGISYKYSDQSDDVSMNWTHSYNNNYSHSIIVINPE